MISAEPDSLAAARADFLDDPELLADFLLESREHLASVERNLLELERNPGQSAIIHATFRSFHTIKGLAGFLGLGAVQQVAHETETLLDRARDGSLPIHAGLIDVILRSSDYLSSALNRIEARRPVEQSGPPSLLRDIAKAAAGIVAVPTRFETFALHEPLEKTAAAPSLKVDAAKIQHLIDLVGELVIAQSILRQNSHAANAAFSHQLAHLSQITADVQKTAMSIRMAPVSSLFRKMSRVVRDVAAKSRKTVSLQLSGEHAEMDRKILDALTGPLMHMVRNAIDHGIEPPDERIARGKNPSGILLLRADREAGNIVIEISDDGRGLNSAKIRRKAIDRGWIAENANLTPDEIYRLIFEPGFSTAETVSEISGRGVGMDVVRQQVEELRGRIEIRSVPGCGASFLVRVPVTPPARMPATAS